MPRIRYLKPDFFKDEDLAKLNYETRLFFAGLWCMADKAGRLEDRPERLKIEIFPYDNVDVEKCLSVLSQPKGVNREPFINRYSSNKKRYIQIVNWNKHQRPHHTEKESEIPPFNPPITEKGMEKGMGMEKQLNASPKLKDGSIPVKQLLSNHPPYTLEQINEANIGILTDGEAEAFFEYMDSQGWKWPNGLVAGGLQSSLQRWKRNRPRFEKKTNDLQSMLKKAHEELGDTK